jgi:membrane-associated phospholipid phosphatase
MSMRTSELVNLAYFLGMTALALVWSLPARARIRAVLLGLAGLVLTGVSLNAGKWMTDYASAIVRDWICVPLMPVAYWQSGWFFQRANPRLQAIFERSDRAILNWLGVDLANPAHPSIRALLELAYVFCYPVVPLSLAALFVSGYRQEADTYWTVVLASAYPCYALLPFVQLLPPRLAEKTDDAARQGRGLRQLNLWLVRHITHEANTFPSGHVAASAAIALVLLRFTPIAGAVFALIALGIAVGCVAGRYHYAIDVAAALLLAGSMFVLVWLVG